MKAKRFLAAAASAVLILAGCNLMGESADKKHHHDDAETPAEDQQVWYAFAQSRGGFALTRRSFAYTSSSFEELDEYWTGSAWTRFLGLKGSLAADSGTAYSATLTAIYMPNAAGTFDWYGASTAEFASYRKYVWSTASDTAKIAIEASGGSLSLKRDQDGDGALDGPADSAESFGTASTTALPGSGAYPELQYISLNFHGSATTLYSYAQLSSLIGKAVDDSAGSLVSSISVKVTDAAGTASAAQTMSWYADRQEWGVAPYTFTNPSDGGIWRISEIDISYKDGSSATYAADSAYANYAVAYTTDTGYSGSGTTSTLAAQDYMPPDSAGSGTFCYIETEPNGSSSAGDGFDAKIYLYAAGDLQHWIAANDDGHEEGSQDDSLYSELKVALASGTYYLKVTEINEGPGCYSLRVNSSGFTNAVSSGTVSGADPYEDDDTAAAAKTITIGATQDRSYTPYDVDWVKFIVP